MSSFFSIIKPYFVSPKTSGQTDLGEAKFYKEFSDGLNKIIEDFTSKKGFLNKLSSFYKHCKNNPQSKSIIIKQLGKTTLMVINLDEFLSLDIIMQGLFFISTEVSLINILIKTFMMSLIFQQKKFQKI